MKNDKMIWQSKDIEIITPIQNKETPSNDQRTATDARQSDFEYLEATDPSQANSRQH